MLRTVFLQALLGALLVSAIPFDLGKGRRLIKTSEKAPAKWLSESEVQKLVAKEQGFIDITDLRSFPDKALPILSTKGIPTTLRYQEVVRRAIGDINNLRIKSFLDYFTSFHNRFLNATTGVQSEKWLLGEINSTIRDPSYPGSISVGEFYHSGWMQDSIIVTIEGADPNLRSQRVILGAHQDTINIQNGSDYVNQYAPGADDNASGCITLLEALQCIVKSKVVPRRTIEFHWYAAEERGLLGSMEIAEKYKTDGIDVIAMINYDVVGYHVEGNDDVAIITDYVNQDLTQFLRIVVDGYLTFGRIERPCGYACSDHASWTQYGFPAARPTQAVRNPQMHTVSDTVETVYLTQIAEFVKISLGFAIEIAEPVQSKHGNDKTHHITIGMNLKV